MACICNGAGGCVLNFRVAVISEFHSHSHRIDKGFEYYKVSHRNV